MPRTEYVTLYLKIPDSPTASSVLDPERQTLPKPWTYATLSFERIAIAVGGLLLRYPVTSLLAKPVNTNGSCLPVSIYLKHQSPQDPDSIPLVKMSLKATSMISLDFNGNPRFVLYGGLVAFALTYILCIKCLKGRKILRRPSSSDLEKPPKKRSQSFKAPVRPLGEWTPSDFKRPVASPLLDWDVHKSEPLPYRPFKYGPYHITMGLRNMQWDEWIELDNYFLKFHAEKARRIAERGDKCCRTAPDAMCGAIELLEEL